MKCCETCVHQSVCGYIDAMEELQETTPLNFEHCTCAEHSSCHVSFEGVTTSRLPVEEVDTRTSVVAILLNVINTTVAGGNTITTIEMNSVMMRMLEQEIIKNAVQPIPPGVGIEKFMGYPISIKESLPDWYFLMGTI